MYKNLFLAIVISMFNSLVNSQIVDWRGPDRSGSYIESNLLKVWPDEGPKLVWSDSIFGSGYSSPLVVGNKIYVPGMIDSTGYIFCCDSEGSLLWKKEYGPEWNKSYVGARSNLIFKDNSLYFLSGYGLLFKMDASDGSFHWTKNMVDDFGGEIPVFGYSETPLLVDDRIIVTPGGKHTLVSLNQSDGSIIWKSPGDNDPAGYCSARYFVHNNRKIIATMTKSYFKGFDYITGDTLWNIYTYKIYTDNTSTPWYFDDKIYMVAPYGEGSKLYQLNEDGSSLSLIWENKAFDVQIGGYVIEDGYIYGNAVTKKYWTCIDLTNGEIKWAERNIGAGSIVSADKMLYFFSDKGDVALVNPSPDTLQIVSKFKAFEGSQQFAHPVIANGRLYLRHQNQVKVFDIKKPELD